MPRYAAFLRAINVGGRVVKMDRLRAILTEAGLDDVRTWIASGNVTFAAAARSAAVLEPRIEATLRDALGYEVATFVRTPDALGAVAVHDPFAAAPVAGATVQVGFLRAGTDAAARARVLALATPVDDLALVGRELWWRCRARVSDSLIRPGAPERALGAPATFRNLTTVRKIADAWARA